jgi:Protein of unknown function (DUF3300)
MKDTRPIPVVVRNVVSGLCALLLILFPGGAMLFAQDVPNQGAPQYQGPQGAPPYQGDPQYQGPGQQDGPQGQGQVLSPDQLSNLVAPVALYPDNLLSQVLAASTYPLEVVAAAQWLQQNRNLQGQQLMDAARQQNWDPSIQAMVAFPDVLNRLASDVQWTTALGNAFLAQQPDVMSAVQRLRAEARSNGKLNSNTQQQVTTQQQNGQTAIDIAPVNPQVVYVPVYNPEYIWGPPVYGYYPPLYYPGFAFGFGFGPGIYLGGFFPGFGFGFGGWGWGFNWFGGGIFTRGLFFSNFGFHPGWGGWRGGAWSHVAGHRLGVPYSNRAVASRFGGNFNARGGLGRTGTAPGFANNGARGNSFNGAHANGFNGARNGSSVNGSRSFSQGNHAEGGNWQHFNGQSGAGARTGQPAARSNPSVGGNNSFRGGASNGASNSFHGAPSAPSARPSGGSFSAPRSSGGSSFHGGGGGGGFHGGGGGGSHGGGGGHGGGGHR